MGFSHSFINTFHLLRVAFTFAFHVQVLSLLSDKTCYHKISRNTEAVRLVSYDNCITLKFDMRLGMPNFTAIGQIWNYILRFRDFPKSCWKTPYSLAWWRHDMETFPPYWPFVKGIRRSPVDSPNKGSVRQSFGVFFDVRLINGWRNGGVSSDLRRHDEVIKWKHFPFYWPFVWGNPPVTGGFPPQRPVTRSFDVSLICTWTNCWANNRDVGDVIRHRAHYDVTVVPWRWCGVTVM